MRWYSIPESAHNGEVTVLAVGETFLSTAAAIFIAVRYQTLTHVALAVIFAPLLLLRTDRSVRLGHRLYWKCFSVSVKVLLLLWVPVIRLHLLLQRRWSLPARVQNILPAALTTVIVLGSVVGAFVARLMAALATLARHPLESMRAIPGNWLRVCLATDSAHVPELLPGVETLRLYWHDESDRPAADVKGLRFWTVLASASRGGIIHRILTLSLATIPILILGYVPALLYRFSVKSTSVVYLPLLWIIGRTSWRPVDLDLTVMDITGLQIERLKRILAWVVLTFFTVAPLIVLYYWLDLRAKLARRPLASFFFPVEEVNSWHIARVVSSVLTLSLFYYADWLKSRLPQLRDGPRQFNLVGLNLAKMIRSAASLFSIACALYIVSVNTDWFRVPGIRLLPSSPMHVDEKGVIREIKKARERVRLLAPSLTNLEIVEALVRAKRHDLDVEVTLDESGAATADSCLRILGTAGIAVFLDATGDMAEDAVLILDERVVIKGHFSVKEGDKEEGGKNLLIPAGPLSPVERYSREYTAHRERSVPWLRQADRWK